MLIISNEHVDSANDEKWKNTFRLFAGAARARAQVFS